MLSGLPESIFKFHAREDKGQPFVLQKGVPLL
jgi:hypothetical protein